MTSREIAKTRGKMRSWRSALEILRKSSPLKLVGVYGSSAAVNDTKHILEEIRPKTKKEEGARLLCQPAKQRTRLRDMGSREGKRKRY